MASCYRFCPGVEFVFVAIIVSNAVCFSMATTSALQQSSDVFHEVKVVNFLIDLLDMHPDLIHMELVKIDSSEPQCVVIIDSVKKLVELRDFQQKYTGMARLKAPLRDQHFSWFEFTRETIFCIDRPVMFTHELIKHQPVHLCNSAALKAPRTQSGESVRWSHHNYLQTSFHNVVSAKNVSVIDRNTGKAEPVSFDVRNKKRWKKETRRALEQSSDDFRELSSIHFLIDLLNMHSELIHMEIVKIHSSEPQCVVIIDSVKKMMALREFKRKYKYLATMKHLLRVQHFLWFELTTQISSRIDRTVIFTHELIKHQPAHLCNSAALKAPRTRNDESVPWSHDSYLKTSLDLVISAKNVSVINRITGKAEPFTSLHVLSGSGRQKTKLKRNWSILDLNQLPSEEALSSLPVRQKTKLKKRQKRKLDDVSSSVPDLNQLPNESDFFWSNERPNGQ